MKKNRSTLIVLILTVVIAIFSAFYLYWQEKSKYKLNFETYSKRINTLIIKDLKLSSRILNAFDSFIYSNQNFSSEDFTKFSNKILANEINVVSLQWLPYIKDRVKSSLFKIKEFDFEGNFVSAKEREFYFPVLYQVNKDQSVNNIIGFDWASFENRFEALKFAEKYEIEFSFLGNLERFPRAANALIRPIYKNSSNEGKHFRSSNLLGFVVVFIDIQELLDQELEKMTEGQLGLIIYEQIKDKDQILFNPIYSYEELAIEDLDFNQIVEKKKSFSADEFKWGRKVYKLVTYPTGGYQRELNYLPAFITFFLILALGIFIIRFIQVTYKRSDLVEAEVERRTLELKRSNDELINFASIVSHDLREPIRGIANFVSFIIEDYSDKLDEDGIEMLNTIKELSKKSIQLSSSLLEYSRVGKLEFAKQMTNMNDTVEDVIYTLKQFIDENNAEIIVEKELPAIFCDRVRVSEVFRNLITNAIKYNDADTKKVEISFFTDPNEVQIFTVKDNGRGIDPKYHEKIFQIFTRLNDSNIEGSGLGLSLVKKIIDKHDGSIWLESELGGGTTFSFCFEPIIHAASKNNKEELIA